MIEEIEFPSNIDDIEKGFGDKEGEGGPGKYGSAMDECKTGFNELEVYAPSHPPSYIS